LHSRCEVVDAGYWADGSGARRIVRRLVHSDDDVAALRIGESNNLASKRSRALCREIASRRPRIRSTTITRKVSLKFKQLTFVNFISNQLHYIRWSNVLKILVNHF
jgi:hypothetical protein